MYSYYATAQENAASGLARCVANYKDVAALMESFRNHPDCKGQDVQSLLIEPIQRVPRYELLLKSMLKSTLETHPDYKALDEAYTVVKQVATKLDKSLQDKQHAAQIRRVQAALRPPQELLVPARRLLKEGLLIKIGKRSEGKRMFWLFNDILVCGQPSGNTLFKWKHTVTLKPEQDAQPQASGGDDSKQLDFTITGSHTNTGMERNYTLRAKSVEEKDCWLAEISKCLESAQRCLDSRDRGATRVNMDSETKDGAHGVVPALASSAVPTM